MLVSLSLSPKYIGKQQRRSLCTKANHKDDSSEIEFTRQIGAGSSLQGCSTHRNHLVKRIVSLAHLALVRSVHDVSRFLASTIVMRFFAASTLTLHSCGMICSFNLSSLSFLKGCAAISR